MKKAIIFDLQGTLIENGVFPSPIKQVKYFLRVKPDFHEFVIGFEKAMMTKEYASLTDAFKELYTVFNINPPPFVLDKLVGLWNKNKLLSKPYIDTIDALAHFKKRGFTLILVANIDCFSKDVVDKYALRSYFDKIYLSCDTSLLKSDEALWDMILADNELSTEDLIVVGDSMESDIEPAVARGIDAVLVDRYKRRDYEKKITMLMDLETYLS